MGILHRTRVQGVIIIEMREASFVYSLRDWNMNYKKAVPLFRGTPEQCSVFAKYHENAW